jgi:hypothetical protein
MTLGPQFSTVAFIPEGLLQWLKSNDVEEQSKSANIGGLYFEVGVLNVLVPVVPNSNVIILLYISVFTIKI